MTREEWAERLPLIQAFVEGKTIQRRFYDGVCFSEWQEGSDISFINSADQYRIKPEPKVIWVTSDDCVFDNEGQARLHCCNGKYPYAKYQEVIE